MENKLLTAAKDNIVPIAIGASILNKKPQDLQNESETSPIKFLMDHPLLAAGLVASLGMYLKHVRDSGPTDDKNNPIKSYRR